MIELTWSEDDQVAVVLDWVRRQKPGDLRLEENFEIDGKKRRTDIGVYRGDALEGIVEVKRPDKFRTEGLRGKARDQVERYADARNCNWIAWTDGRTAFVRDCRTGVLSRFAIPHPGGGLFSRLGVELTEFRLGLTDEQYYDFPTRQRSLTTQVIPPELYVSRTAIGFDLDGFLASDHPAALILGDADIGKSTLAQNLAADPAWNALLIDGGAVSGVLIDHVQRNLQHLYGANIALPGFLEDVEALSIQQFGVHIGVVVDGFEEFYASSGNPSATDVVQFARLFERHGGKTIILCRPTLERVFREYEPLRDLLAGLAPARLGLLEEVDLDRFQDKYFGARGIGGTLTGNAREVCRTPGMLDLATEVYEGRDGIDPDLTEPLLFERYREKKLTETFRRQGISAERGHAALHRAAEVMRERDQFAVPYLTLSEALSPKVLDAFVEEGILAVQPVADRRLRFRYGGFRDFLLVDGQVADQAFVDELIARDIPPTGEQS